MNQLATNKSFSLLAYLSLLPLLFALCLALYQAFDMTALTGYTFYFARINSYIYAHSYGALLLALFAGIQIGQTLHSHHRWYLIFNFILLWLAWLSYHSFADAQGVTLLISGWLAALLIDFKAKQNAIIPAWYGWLKIKINLIVLLQLLLILLINR